MYMCLSLLHIGVRTECKEEEEEEKERGVEEEKEEEVVGRQGGWGGSGEEGAGLEKGEVEIKSGLEKEGWEEKEEEEEEVGKRGGREEERGRRKHMDLFKNTAIKETELGLFFSKA